MEKTLTDNELMALLKAAKNQKDALLRQLEKPGSLESPFFIEVAEERRDLINAIEKLDGCEEVVIHSKN